MTNTNYDNRYGEHFRHIQYYMLYSLLHAGNPASPTAVSLRLPHGYTKLATRNAQPVHVPQTLSSQLLRKSGWVTVPYAGLRPSVC